MCVCAVLYTVCYVLTACLLCISNFIYVWADNMPDIHTYAWLSFSVFVDLVCSELLILCVHVSVPVCPFTIKCIFACVSVHNHNHVFVSLHVYVHNHMYLCLCRRLPCADRLLAVRAHSSPWKKGPEYAPCSAVLSTRVCVLSGFSWICIMFLKTWSISSLVTSTSQQPSKVNRYVVYIYVKHLSAPLWWARMLVLMGDQEHRGGCAGYRWGEILRSSIFWPGFLPLIASGCPK